MLSSRFLKQSLRAGISKATSRAPPAVLPRRQFAITAVQRTRISEVITSDHRDLEDAYNHIKSAANEEDQIKWQNQFTWALARHSLGEELVVYPSMEKHLNNGPEMAEHDRMEHQVVKELLYTFQGLKPTDPEFMPVLENLWGNLAQHIKEEEGKDMPQLEKTLDDGESRQMAASFHRTKQFVPTRSHPNAPNKPPFETVVGLMAAPMDKIRDMFRSFPETKDQATK
ncbi:hypothetical protein BP00DRAFT_386642 [Aspergillus indologenus CBS 114.80]|uniref:Hemerythrin-like domain-containing protein n=1 Tax=Aspergillus indologenus CBS 114.80 TaxID=1450541 RepID=A0A2V5IHM1_9EURO|nr:hypothetical protein BP00DRAFT_386642 [Aspergillus indologenus CBS 114.80]